MYLYKVTTIDGQHYIGVGEGDGRGKLRTTDPQGVFPSTVFNGQYQQRNTSIQVLGRGGRDRIERMIDTYIKSNNSDPKFYGLVGYQTPSQQIIPDDELKPPKFDLQKFEDEYEGEEDELEIVGIVEDVELGFDEMGDIDDDFFTYDEEE